MQLFEDCVVPLQEVIRTAFRISPATWCGRLDLYVIGRAGEVLLATGMVPGLRSVVPKARICMHVMDNYACVVSGAAKPFKPDEAPLLVPPYGRRSIVADVAALFGVFPHGGFVVEPQFDRISVSVYRTHPWYHWGDASHEGTLIDGFCAAVGLDAGKWRMPLWTGEADPNGYHDVDGTVLGALPPRLVVAMPTTHQGSSATGQVPVAEATWRVWGERLRALGFECWATGHPQDGRARLPPPWTWIECDLHHAMVMLSKASLVIAGNSGLAYASIPLSGSRAKLLCIDDTGYAHGLARHWDRHPEFTSRMVVADVAGLLRTTFDEHIEACEAL